MYFIKDTKVFFNNKKDKNALKKAKETLTAIKKSEDFDLAFSRGNTSNNLDYEKIDDNVYLLRKTI